MYIRLFRIIYIRNRSMFNPAKLVIIGVVVAVIYFLLKFIEMRFVESDNQKPVKVLVRDSIIVCISAVLAVFIMNQFDNISASSGEGGISTPAVFVDTPGF